MLETRRLVHLFAVSLSLAACSAQSNYDDENHSGQSDDDIGPDAGIPSPPADAATPQQQPDAAVPTDAGCVAMVAQLLVNPAFDATPVGTGWTQKLIDPDAPLITDEDGVPEHSAPYKAWLGGLVAPLGTTVKDVLTQELVVPANTTQLTLTGYYDVRTAEAPGTIAYDKATVSLLASDGTVIATMLSLSNLTPKADWTQFGHIFTQDLSGQTVKLRITSINDDLDVTSFFFDGLALNAITGCPPVQ